MNIWSYGPLIRIDQEISHARTLIEEGDIFKYIIPDSEYFNSLWFLSFDDSNWNNGNSGFGYADNDDNTNIPWHHFVYLKKKSKFQILARYQIDFRY